VVFGPPFSRIIVRLSGYPASTVNLKKALSRDGAFFFCLYGDYSAKIIRKDEELWQIMPNSVIILTDSS